MGWNVSADARRSLYNEHTSLQPTVVTDDNEVTVIDGNAKGRSLAVGTRGAAAVARQILECVGPATKEVVICFDNDNVPDVRKREVHTARAARAASSAKRATPASAEEIASFKGVGEVEWERLFASSAGKRAALLVLCRALKTEIVRRSMPECRFTLTMPDATVDAFAAAVWAYPFGQPSTFESVLCATQYGEAEAQIIACIRHSMAEAREAGREPPVTTIHTIDTDVYLQCLSFAHPHLRVVIGVVWKTRDGALHSSAARARTASSGIRPVKRLKPEAAPAVAAVTRLYQHVSLSDFAESMFASDLAGMVNAQWWFLLSGGCDYNFTGLAAFGWNHKTCLSMRTRTVIDRSSGTLLLGTFAAQLRRNRNARRRNTDVARFCEMLERTIYCWHYYQWSGPQPELAQFTGLIEAGESETITDWLCAVPPDAQCSLTPAREEC
tara:strand:- start:7121 stop:8443 length:1323 start_codon:yes stop_codon:yes gene_type:complete